MKNFLNKLWLVLTVAGVASAMDIAPFYFGNAAGTDAETQEAEWNYLMKYKMFGASGIKFENGNIRVTDSVGWFGTSHGNLSFQNGDDSIGGPILIGGDIDIKMGPEVFVNGPVNVTGNILVGQETNFASKPNEFHGHQCVQGDVPSVYASLIGNEYKHFGVEGTASVNSNNGYKDCLDTTKGLKVPEVRNNLYIPELNTAPTYSTELKTRVTNLNTLSVEEKTGSVTAVDVNNQIYEIYIPEGDPQEPFDIYLDHITLTNDATLLFNMQDGGRLTRIFLNGSISFSSTTNIAVQYDTLSNGTYIRQENEDYNGTLLFYTTKDISFQSTNQNSHPSLQGSILTTGTIVINDHIKLAGQLLADIIRINYNFDGSNFIFVPFNPTILDFDPTALAEGKFIENNQTVLVPIKLDTLASVDVSFRYCFDIKDSSLTDPNSKIASIQDFNSITPVCGKDTGSVKILMGDTVPRGDYNVYINVAIDTLFEGQETLPLKVFGLAGAVMPGNKRQGSFMLPIVDDPTPASLKKIVLDSVPENSPVGTRIDSLMAIRGSKFCTHCKFALADSTDYVYVSETGLVTVRDSSILDYESITEIKIRVLVIDTLYQKTSDTTVTIPIINVNENPILDDQEFDVDEHKVPGTVVGTLEWGENDSVPVFRQDVFTAVGGDTAYFSITSEGVIKTKKEFDYETEPHTYTIDVMLADKNDPTLYVVATITITINDVNEAPRIVTDTIQVKENSDPGTIVDTLEAIDKDNDSLTWTLVEDPSKCFDVSVTGVVTTKKCDNLDYEKNKTISIKVSVSDNRGGVDTKIIVVKLIDVPAPDLKITEASNEDSLWKNPEIIYTHTDSLNLCWEINKANKDCSDTTLKPGENKICKEVCDVDGFEGCSKDCFIAYYSDVSPLVYIDAGGDANLASNIYTIVEQPAEGDTNVYVKDTVRQITVHITDKDPIRGDSSYSFTIPVDLTKKVSVPQKTYDALSNVAKQTVALDELNPKTKVTPINGTNYLNSYPTTIAGIEVTVSYVTDTKGNVVKQAVVNEKGKVDSIEVITVTYETEIDGQKVKVSYQADATTGKALNVDGNGGFIATKNSDVSTGVFKVSYEYTDKKTGNAVELTYIVDDKGNMVKNPEGDRGYQVSYTYVDKYGNAAKQSVFVVLDQTLPTVEILKPVDNQVAHTNFVNIEWTVNGEKQDSLTVQGLVKGPNIIVRFYKDKAGNIAADTVRVYMKDGKDLDIAVERPVIIVTKDKVEEYYAENAPVKGQTFAVSVKNPTTGDEVETLIGGSFKTKDGSGEKPYAGVSDSKHLGPTLILDVVLPTVSDGKSGTVSGLATMDDLMLSNGRISSAGMGVDTSKLDYEAKKDYKEYTVDEYVSQFCEDGTKIPDDASAFNLYNSKLKIKIWVYTTLGNFVSDYSFTQELNDPSYANEAGLTKLYFELKPDKDGYVHAENGKLMATGAYVYKVEASLQNKLRCSIPPFNGGTGKTKGDVTRSREELLKPFGYKRPSNK
ncbi:MULTISPECIES: cadherin repeat domain-containing protein [unclassified Fibrobacter]|uniref:cadherin repeat domain-containing protein n=1 Tax=unclassified Fibrobacter TaxID=2634177 RepID=UPI001304915C|nr:MULTISPECIES: cadherin repeat domain-containing protein [unclassified Fibrobacter]